MSPRAYLALARAAFAAGRYSLADLYVEIGRLKMKQEQGS